VAAGLCDWDVCPREAQAVVAALGMRLAMSVRHHYREHHHAIRSACAGVGERVFGVPDIMRTLDAGAALGR
jgi:hypothetical protein